MDEVDRHAQKEFARAKAAKEGHDSHRISERVAALERFRDTLEGKDGINVKGTIISLDKPATTAAKKEGDVLRAYVNVEGEAVLYDFTAKRVGG